MGADAAPQVCPQLPVTPNEQNQLCRLQGLIHPGPGWPGTDCFSVLLTPLVVAALGLDHLCTSSLLLLCQKRQFGSQLYLNGGSGYITTCETELWLCYIRAPLSILWKWKINIYFWGRPLWLWYEVPQCHWEWKFNFYFLKKKNYFQEGERVSALFAV